MTPHLVASAAYTYTGPHRRCGRCPRDVTPGDLVRALHIGPAERGAAVSHAECVEDVPLPAPRHRSTTLRLDTAPRPLEADERTACDAGCGPACGHR